MNSSTGFKKRTLLRPASGMRQRQKQFLRVFDISQSQPMIANQIKSEINKIQQEINEIDKDKKIRIGQASLQKSYVSTLKKWLRQVINAQDRQDDDGKILKYMGVDSYEAGFRKMWKILSNLDHMVTKITQLEIIQFLKYDQTFDQLSKDSQKSAQTLSTISKAGFTAGTFQISQILLQRSKDIYSICLESKRKGTSFLTNTSQREVIKKSDKQVSKKSQTNELISQLQKENSKLSELLEQLQRQKQNNQSLMKQLKSKQQIIKKKQQIIKQNTNISNNASITPSQNRLASSPSDIFSQLQDRYKIQLTQLSQKLYKLQTQLSEIKIILSTTQSKLKLAQDDLKQSDPIKSIKPKTGSYEEALMEEMDKMRNGFQRKIKILIEDFNTKEKDMRRRQIDYKTDNQKIKWEKTLLLKKFDSITNHK